MRTMHKLHIVQGGIENGDKDWLEKAARRGWAARTWTAPKSASPGDEVVIYVLGYGFFATAKVKSRPKPRENWPKRYRVGLHSIALIEPPVSLFTIRRSIPNLKWAIYPRSIHTPAPQIAAQVQQLIGKRRRTGTPDLDNESLAAANLLELRKAALLRARRTATARQRKIIQRVRIRAIRLYVLQRAKGHCESCCAPAPFCSADGRPFLEPHHTRRLADDGPDHPAWVIGLCPNCHRRAHHSEDATVFNRSLLKRLRGLEPKGL